MYTSPDQRGWDHPSERYHWEAIIAGLADVARRALDRDPLIRTMLSKSAIGEAIENRVDRNQPFGVFVIDLNNFKLVNDTLGHPFGDRVLIEFGALLHEAFKRDTDELGTLREVSGLIHGRSGGDEFIILVDLCGNGRRTPEQIDQMDSVYEFLQMLEERFKERAALLDERVGALELGFAVGGAVFDPDYPVDAMTLVLQADEAMYEEKGDSARK